MHAIVSAGRLSEARLVVMRRAGATTSAVVAVLVGCGCIDLKSDAQLEALRDGAKLDDADGPFADADDSPNDAPIDSEVIPDAPGQVSADADARLDRAGDARPADVTDADGEKDGGDADANASDVQDGAADGVLDIDACTPDCPALGQFRCGGAADASVWRQVQVCSLARGCLQWLDTATCGVDEECCEGSCRALATSRCSVPTGYDYYADASRGADDVDAGPSELGTRDRPFRTVTRAIVAATSLPRPGRRIYVAAGRYDAQLGETFPLVLRSGVSLHGEGAQSVIIKGSGTLDRRAAGNVYGGIYNVTLMVGDPTALTTVSGLTILGDTSSPQPSYFGVFCDRGSGPQTTATEGVTSLENLVVGPGFQNAIMAVASTSPHVSACNLRLRGSTVTGSLGGVVAQGCPVGGSSPHVAVQIGDAEKGNTFSWIGDVSSAGVGVLAVGCVTNSTIVNSTFDHCAHGVSIDQRDNAPPGTNIFSIEKNVFSTLWSVGVGIAGDPPRVDLLDNQFTNVSTANIGGNSWAVALRVGSDTGHIPLRRARRNTFVGNDLGVWVSSPVSATFAAGGPFDLGTLGDPGGNVFRCNSVIGGVAAGDVLIDVPGPGSVPLEGNTWDHFPPTVGIHESNANGTDVTFVDFGDAGAPRLETTIGTADSTACPANRVHGPPTDVEAVR